MTIYSLLHEVCHHFRNYIFTCILLGTLMNNTYAVATRTSYMFQRIYSDLIFPVMVIKWLGRQFRIDQDINGSHTIFNSLSKRFFYLLIISLSMILLSFNAISIRYIPLLKSNCILDTLSTNTFVRTL